MSFFKLLQLITPLRQELKTWNKLQKKGYGRSTGGENLMKIWQADITELKFYLRQKGTLESNSTFFFFFQYLKTVFFQTQIQHDSTHTEF